MDTIKNATTEKANCHDCQKEIAIQGEEIQNGVMLEYDNKGEKIAVFKCQSCFEQSQELKNYQPCEVYSRIVGYLRPVDQWNKGKQEEFKDRKNLEIKKDCC
ncbi:MAG: anaerobic ribonucleoside-triphosphate reductase [Patescibacteria group bacterium]